MVREAPPAELPTELQGGRFHVLSLLARGAQGLTLVAEDRQRGGRVAIKRFQVQGAPSWKQVELAEREAEVLSTLSHPNLPAYITHFEQAGALYLVMELVEGKTLAELKREGALSQRDVLEFMADVAQTLDYLHGRAPPIIHRDVKPSNVIRRPNGSFVLVDFGSVRDKLRPEGGSTVVGTFGYMAPEQVQGRALPVTDTYGLGATAVACLSGEDPEHLPHRGLAIDVRHALAGRAEPSLLALLERMLEPDPERRPSDLLGALRAISSADAKGPAQASPRSQRVAEQGAARHGAASSSWSGLALALFVAAGIVAAVAERPLFPLWLMVAIVLFVRHRRASSPAGDERFRAQTHDVDDVKAKERRYGERDPEAPDEHRREARR